MNVLALLGSVLFLNAVGASVDALLNLYLIHRATQLPFSFGVAILVMNTADVFGSVAGICYIQVTFRGGRFVVSC